VISQYHREHGTASDSLEVPAAAAKESFCSGRESGLSDGCRAARALVPDASDMPPPRQERFRVAAAAVLAGGHADLGATD
jgi:hypothetical protein